MGKQRIAAKWSSYLPGKSKRKCECWLVVKAMTRSFFDLKGTPCWYTTDGEWFYSYSEHRPVAFFESLPVDPNRRSLFAPTSGEYLGWFENGWIYNRSGKPWMFAEQTVR